MDEHNAGYTSGAIVLQKFDFSVADPALMLINPYPWSAPLEDVKLKK